MDIDAERELMQLLADSGAPVQVQNEIQPAKDLPLLTKVDAEKSGICQWTSGDGKHFFGASRTTATLPPGLYDIEISPTTGLYFSRVPIKTEGLLRFPHTNSEAVLREIATFWDRANVFAEYKLVHKRGILLWGPPGSGKSSTIQLLLHDVVARGGVAIRFGHPGLFSEGMRVLRDIQPETPVIALMEDLDSILARNSESQILNILDGVEAVNRTVFLASTNYPERLGPRIINRPSRFDKRIKIGHPTPDSRRMYFQSLVKPPTSIDVERWVAETEGFSFAHLRELFIAVVILGDTYESAIETLCHMKEGISSEADYGNRKLGILGDRLLPKATGFGLGAAAPSRS